MLIFSSVQGDWSTWSNWTQCDRNENYTRSRNCSNPKPQHGGKNCTGVNIETKYCPGIIYLKISYLLVVIKLITL